MNLSTGSKLCAGSAEVGSSAGSYASTTAADGTLLFGAIVTGRLLPSEGHLNAMSSFEKFSFKLIYSLPRGLFFNAGVLAVVDTASCVSSARILYRQGWERS